jgi:hypothetical protein
MFLYYLGVRFHDPAALWYAREVAGNRDLDSLLPPLLRFDRILEEDSGQLPQPRLPSDLPEARVFRDVGIVTMHTNLANADKNLMLAFRASPFGSFNHMHSDQNSLHVVCQGKRLFSGSGYYIAYGDDHFQNWYTHSRGHNTVMIDGTGQVRGADGYGWVARYMHGREITYCAGDASNAYGDAGLKRFRRHVVFLRPNIVVLYDDLAADHAARWSWLLHSPDEIEVQADQQRLFASADTVRAQVDLFGSDELKMTVSDQFDPPAINWRNKSSGGRTIEYPNQWHVTAVPVEEASRARFLAIYQIQVGGSTSFDVPTRESEETICVSNWRITAGLKPPQAAMLLVERTDGKAALAVDRPTVTVAGVQHGSSGSESLLVEGTQPIILRCTDEVPDAIR